MNEHQCVNCPVKGCLLSLTLTKNQKILEQCPCGKCLVNTMCDVVCEDRMEFTKKIFVKSEWADKNL
jgi:hypothetical protein